MKRRIMREKSVLVYIQSAFSEIETTRRREGFTRAATDCLKINIIRFVRIRAGDIDRRDRRFAAISHEEVPEPRRTTGRVVGKRV